ncbi:MAG: hypothetical protein N2314_02580 [Brevinematales bacterium]|nr:hypothetical protein [Brevinematales bacterium]
MKEHKPFPVTLLILAFLIFCAAGFLLLTYWQTHLKQSIGDLQKAIQSLTNESLLAEISLSQTSPELSGQIVFYSPSGRALHSEAFEMGGNDIYLEFHLISWKYETNRFVFGYPLRLYSDVVAPTDGIDILEAFTNALIQGQEGEKLASLLISGTIPQNIQILQTRTIAIHQYPGKSWQKGHYLILSRQDSTLELKEK